MSDHVLVKPGEADMSAVARGLLDTATALGLSTDVVVYSPSLGGFKVPEEVAGAYAAMQEPTGDFGPVAPPNVPEDSQDEADNGQAATSPLSPLQQAIAGQDPSGPRRFTDDEKAAAVRLVLEEGKTIAEAAEISGASATSVSKWVGAAKNEGGA